MNLLSSRRLLSWPVGDVPAEPAPVSEVDLADAGDFDVVLWSGDSATDLTLRTAQRVLKHDGAPSDWARAGIVHQGEVLTTLPNDFAALSLHAPATNSVGRVALDRIQEAGNLCLIKVVPTDRQGRLGQAVAELDRGRARRDLADLTELILPWLAYLWGHPQAVNPLTLGLAEPSAALVESIFVRADIDLMPGLRAPVACAEALWQGATLWREFFEGLHEDGLIEGELRVAHRLGLVS